MRGPPLKGQKMNGFEVRYLILSSRKRSGSNLVAVKRRSRLAGLC